jgi:hypothetical protein
MQTEVFVTGGKIDQAFLALCKTMLCFFNMFQSVSNLTRKRREVRVAFQQAF